MNLTPEQEAQVLTAVTSELVEKAWEKLEGQLEEVTCISLSRLAGMLDLSTSQTRRVLEEVVEFGPRDMRVTLAQAKDLVESRKVKRE